MSAFSGLLMIVCWVLFTLNSIMEHKLASTEFPSSEYSFSYSLIIAKSWTTQSRKVFNLIMKKDFRNFISNVLIWLIWLTRKVCKTELCKPNKRFWSAAAPTWSTFVKVRFWCRSKISRLEIWHFPPLLPPQVFLLPAFPWSTFWSENIFV